MTSRRVRYLQLRQPGGASGRTDSLAVTVSLPRASRSPAFGAAASNRCRHGGRRLSRDVSVSAMAVGKLSGPVRLPRRGARGRPTSASGRRHRSNSWSVT
jgi:hypothetical protein